MAENLTLEKELSERIMVHKVAVAGGVLAHEYMQRENNSAVKLPPFQMSAQADEYSNQVMRDAMVKGTFDELYEESWDKVKNFMPEHLKVVELAN